MQTFRDFAIYFSFVLAAAVFFLLQKEKKKQKSQSPLPKGRGLSREAQDKKLKAGSFSKNTFRKKAVLPRPAARTRYKNVLPKEDVVAEKIQSPAGDKQQTEKAQSPGLGKQGSEKVLLSWKKVLVLSEVFKKTKF